MSRESPTPTTSDEATFISIANQLISASTSSPLSEVRRLIKSGAPTWYQEPTMGWSCLHFAAERGDPKIVKALLQGGAVWNAVDHLGYTPADVAISVNDAESYFLIKNEGLRSEMLHHAILAAQPAQPSIEPTTNTESSTLTESSNTLTLRQSDTTSAGSNLTFLKSKLIWEKGDDGRERVMDGDGNGVMMGWEEPLMKEHVRLMCESKGEDEEGPTVLNVGFGLGIIDRIFQSLTPKPTHHVIIEAHPQVLQYIRSTGFDKIPGVTILEGRWQDWINDEMIGEVMKLTAPARDKDSVAKPATEAGTPEEEEDWESYGNGFDAVFVDTFAEGYEDLKLFFEQLPNLLSGPQAAFSFWNGLGATNLSIYDVASDLAELHLNDVGMVVAWHRMLIDDNMAEDTWRGVKRRYWTLPVYKLPIAKLSM